jgi:hypothetical protein
MVVLFLKLKHYNLKPKSNEIVYLLLFRLSEDINVEIIYFSRYEQLRETVLSAERDLLQTIGFSLTVQVYIFTHTR